MQLTAFSDYALRLMMMATAHNNRLVTIEETARTFDISRAHLMKVAHHLVRQGFFEDGAGTHRRTDTGEAPETIRVGEIIRSTERELALVECFGVYNQCRITPRCRLRGVLADAFDAFMTVLDRHTLRDLVRNPQDFGLSAIR